MVIILTLLGACGESKDSDTGGEYVCEGDIQEHECESAQRYTYRCDHCGGWYCDGSEWRVASVDCDCLDSGGHLDTGSMACPPIERRR